MAGSTNLRMLVLVLVSESVFWPPVGGESVFGHRLEEMWVADGEMAGGEMADGEKAEHDLASLSQESESRTARCV